MVCMTDVYRGISIEGIDMSHLICANDVDLKVVWDQLNALHIVCILRCFFMASGLKINLLKIKLSSVGVSVDHVSSIE